MLHQLIQNLCPNGVEYKTLGEIKTAIYRGAGITEAELVEEGTPCIRYGEIYTTYGIWFDSCVSFVDETQIKSKKYMEHGDILFAITGESVEEIAKSTVYMGHERCLVGGDIVVMKHNQNPKYLSYALSTQQAQKQKSKGKVKSKVVHSNVPSIEMICIPVPPIEIQNEIVQILDEYSEKNAQLIDVLKSELEARKVQYEYYREAVLKSLERYSVELGTCCGFQNGFAFKSAKFKEIGLPVVRISNIQGSSISRNRMVYFDAADYKENLERYILRRGDIVIAMSGATTGKIAVNNSDETFYINQRVGKFVPNSKLLLSEFLFFILEANAQSILKMSEGGAQPNLSSEDIKKMMIPIPPIEVQKQIVKQISELRICSVELIESIEKEIKLRQNQYEYYRDKLLAFQEAN